MSIAFPIFIHAKDCGEVAKFESLDEMQRELEAIDIENGEYEAWDQNGTPMNMAVQTPVWLKLEPSASVPRPSELKEIILRFASSAGVQFNDEDTTSVDCETLFQRVVAEVETQKSSGGLLKKLLGRRSN